jgi:hypothetical protein
VKLEAFAAIDEEKSKIAAAPQLVAKLLWTVDEMFIAITLQGYLHFSLCVEPRESQADSAP